MSNTIGSNTIYDPKKSYPSRTPTHICSRCIMDDTVYGIQFDDDGVCNFCKLHETLEEKFPNDARGARILDEYVEKIKHSGKGRPYDCVVGISGGRDSTYALYLAKKVWGLRPLAVHFNDGFGNPVTGQNMLQTVKNLDVEMRTITSDWRESKDLRIALLKSSTLNFGISTDIGLFNALFGVAHKEKIKYIIVGHSFRTEGIVPLVWSYLDGYNLKKIHEQYGTVPLRSWKPDDPGFHYDYKHIFYYGFIKRIKILTPLYYSDYVRSKVDKLLTEEVGWVNSGAHYYDDLYQSLLFHLERVKYNVDRRKPNYSALIRSGQMDREEALKRLETPYVIEDPKVIDLCIKRLGLTRDDLAKIVDQPPRYFYDFPNRYSMLKTARPIIKLLCLLNMIPKATYDKYFNCGY